jgi:hypothetical protein
MLFENLPVSAKKKPARFLVPNVNQKICKKAIVQIVQKNQNPAHLVLAKAAAAAQVAVNTLILFKIAFCGYNLKELGPRPVRSICH